VAANSPIDQGRKRALLDFRSQFGAGGGGGGLQLRSSFDDGMMAVLLLRRRVEIQARAVVGELRHTRSSALIPAVAALGGIGWCRGADLLSDLNPRGPGRAGGWGIPVATDIAYEWPAKLLRAHVANGLKVFPPRCGVDDWGAS